MVLLGIWLPLGVFVAVAAILLRRPYGKKFGSAAGSSSRIPLPPSPAGAWPIVGHLPLLGALPHRALLELAKKYGPVMYMRLGSVPMIVVSSADMLREFFQVHDVIMASRPKSSMGEIMAFNCQDIAYQPYGELWRSMRKLFMQELLSVKRLNELQAMRRREVLLSLESISYRAKQSADSSVNVRMELRDMSFNNLTQ